MEGIVRILSFLERRLNISLNNSLKGKHLGVKGLDASRVLFLVFRFCPLCADPSTPSGDQETEVCEKNGFRLFPAAFD